MAKHIRHESRVQNLEFAGSWGQLSDQEKNYAYYMSKAAWAGVFINIHQISYEGPIIFALFQAYFADKNFDELQAAAMGGVEGLTQDDWKNFIAYVGGFYGNLSNYHSFGHMKFVPELAEEKFWGILRSHPKANEAGSPINWALANLVDKIDKEIYAYDAPYTQLNFPHKGGVTAYFSRNMTEEDLNLVSEFLASGECVRKGLDVLNTRAFKINDSEFLITVGSANTDGSCNMTYKEKTFRVEFGEFQEYCAEMNDYLTKALPYVANETQKLMLEKYIESYATGSIPAHKDSQRAWIKDKSPVVETN